MEPKSSRLETHAPKVSPLDSATWSIFQSFAPALHGCLVPMAMASPELLRLTPVCEAIFAVYAMDCSKFRRLQELPPLDIASVLATWRAAVKRAQTDQLTFQRCDGRTVAVWPILLGGIRAVSDQQALPGEFLERDFMRYKRDQPLWAYLHSVANLFNLLQHG